MQSLFSFDNELKKIINNKLEELEKRLKAAIIYHTLRSLNDINENIINLPFILLDDKYSKLISISLFSNSFSNESFLNEMIVVKRNLYLKTIFLF
ncbi:hypothetical protein J6W34_01340 [bacterium]|nr:hypothetical protein [bacterium]